MKRQREVRISRCWLAWLRGEPDASRGFASRSLLRHLSSPLPPSFDVLLNVQRKWMQSSRETEVFLLVTDCYDSFICFRRHNLFVVIIVETVGGAANTLVNESITKCLLSLSEQHPFYESLEYLANVASFCLPEEFLNLPLLNPPSLLLTSPSMNASHRS